MALDYSRLGLENKFLKNKSGRTFCVRQVYQFTKSCQQIFYTFYTSHLRWNSTTRRCIYHINLGKNANLTIIQDKLHLFNIQDDQSWAFCETVQKISKITQYTAGSHFWRAPNLQKCERWSGVWMKINTVTLQHNKEFIMPISYSVVL